MQLTPTPTGIRFKFSNGWALSVQQSDRHYCTDDTVEIMLIDPQDRPYQFGNDTVQGWVPEGLVTSAIAYLGDGMVAQAIRLLESAR